MRELNNEERAILETRRASFESFRMERMPVLADFVALLGLPNPPLVMERASDYLPGIEEWMSRQSVTADDKSWIHSRIGYFVGEYLVQRLKGCWLVNDDPDSRYFSRYVVGRFASSDPRVSVDPFELTADYLIEPPGRSLVSYLDSVERTILNKM